MASNRVHAKFRKACASCIGIRMLLSCSGIWRLLIGVDSLRVQIQTLGPCLDTELLQQCLELVS